MIGPRDFLGVKPRQLLQILALEQGHVVPKSRLAEMLWGDAVPRNYVATLESYVSVARQTLERGVRARDSVIITEHGGYRLDASRVTVDVDEFDELVRSAAGLEPVTALQRLTRALALVRGPLLEDDPYGEWAMQTRDVYRRRHVQVLVDAARLSLVTGETADALRFAEQAVEIDPLAEAAYQVLMTASYALWRQEDALRAFERCRSLLADELGVDPMDETVALHLAILRHEDVGGLLPRSSAPAPTATSPAPAPVVTPAGLLGRRKELAALRSAVDEAMQGRFRVILVVGDAGMGKSRLATALAEGLDVPVGRVRCSDLEQELPYVALSLALRPVLRPAEGGAMPFINELLRRVDLDQGFDRFSRLRVMEEFATAVDENTPCVLVLDDAQWADVETLSTIGYLHRRCADRPMVVVLCASAAVAQGEMLRGLPVDLRIDLQELSEEDLAPLGGDAYAVSQGHPLFLTDHLQAREQDIPQGFTPALRERVITACWRRGPQAYRLLTVAALLEEPFAPALLAELVGAEDDVVEELDLFVEDGLLVAEGQRFRFRYSLVRRILAETFSEARRARLLARDTGQNGAFAQLPDDVRPAQRGEAQVHLLPGAGARRG